MTHMNKACTQEGHEGGTETHGVEHFCDRLLSDQENDQDRQEWCEGQRVNISGVGRASTS